MNITLIILIFLTFYLIYSYYISRDNDLVILIICLIGVIVILLAGMYEKFLISDRFILNLSFWVRLLLAICILSIGIKYTYNLFKKGDQVNLKKVGDVMDDKKLNTINKYLYDLYAKDLDLESGVNNIWSASRDIFPEINISNFKIIDFEQCFNEFNKQLENLLLNNPIPKEIKSISFNFPMEHKYIGFIYHKTSFTFRMIGVTKSPKQNEKGEYIWPNGIDYLLDVESLELNCLRKAHREIISLGNNRVTQSFGRFIIKSILLLFTNNLVRQNKSLFFHNNDRIFLGFSSAGSATITLGEVKIK